MNREQQEQLAREGRLVRDRCDLSRNHRNGFRGIWRDEMYEKGPNGEDVLVKKTSTKCNLITEPMTVLIAGLLLGEPSFLGGILYHAIGEGDASWDTGGIPDPTKYDTQLLNEVSRLTPDGISYIKFAEGTAEATSTVSTIIDTTRFEPDDFFNGMEIEIVAGTNLGEIRTVSDFTQSTGEFVVSVPFPAPIDATSEYQMIPEVSVDPTNVIEVKTTWDYGLPTDPFNFKYIREQGLFGGTATATVNSGLMADRITHERIWKSSVIKLIRMIDIILEV